MSGQKSNIDVNLSGLLSTLLLVLFITLKLCGVIAWSWWWVLSPLWIPLLIGVVCIVIAVIIGGLNA